MQSIYDSPLTLFLVTYPILVFSLTLHELGHAISAKWCGDPTAEREGRVSLNPLVHMDPIGTFLFPLVSIFTSIPLLGWARPVPVVVENLRRPAGDNVIVTMAGPMMNVFLAVGGMLLLQLYNVVVRLHLLDYPELIAAGFHFVLQVLSYVIILNLSLFFFNLIPIPPLDGSHVMRIFLNRYAPPGVIESYRIFCEYSFIAFLLLLVTPAVGIYLGLTAMPLADLMDSYASLPLHILER